MKKTIMLAASLVLAASVASQALDLGDTAPEISPEKWVTGTETDPVKPGDGTFFIVEVWSTTCPPCVRTIPMLNDLQKRYADKGLKIVSFTTDSLEDVEPFLKEHPMEYSSFIDKEGATYINYMAADNRNTIPHAFLFDKSGVLVWIGNPLDNIEDKVKQVLDGTLNGKHAIAVRTARNDLQSASDNQDVDGMIESLKRLETLEPDNLQYYRTHLWVLSQIGGGDTDAVSNLLAAWYDGCREQPEGLMVLALTALYQVPPDQRDPALALAAAKRAFSLDSDSKLEAGLALAETYTGLGRIDLALETISSLDKLVDDPNMREIIDAMTDFYTKAKDVGDNPDAEYKP